MGTANTLIGRPVAVLSGVFSLNKILSLRHLNLLILMLPQETVSIRRNRNKTEKILKKKIYIYKRNGKLIAQTHKKSIKPRSSGQEQTKKLVNEDKDKKNCLE